MKFKVQLLPSDFGYLCITTSMGNSPVMDLDVFDGNNDFSDLNGPTFTEEFTEESYNYWYNKYPEYLPKFDNKDKRFVVTEK